MMQYKTANAQEFKSFREFYPFYLSQHANTVCRLLHFIGSLVVLMLVLAAFSTGQFLLLLALPIAGYGFAWLGHFIFAKNRPATFRYPIYSLIGDWVMFWEILTGRISIKTNTVKQKIFPQ